MEIPDCILKKNITNQAKPVVYKEIQSKLGLDDNHMIDAFTLLGQSNNDHDEFYCDGVHLNSAGSALVGLLAYKQLRKASVIPYNYKQEFV